MDLGNYGIGGNEVKIDASEGIAEFAWSDQQVFG